jgi:CHAP domain
VSLPVVLERIALLQSAFAPPPPPAAAAPTATFSSQLQGAAGSTTLAGATPVANGGTPAGQAIVNLVRNELGVTEEPPGSNESARISQYRKATADAPGPGPWCAYFVSWAAREAGVPIGDSGQGYGLVDDVWAWGERSGKATPAASGPPQAGDLIVWDEHIGVVESVAADGTITTIEGNSSNSVARRTYGSGGGGAIGWVRLG